MLTPFTGDLRDDLCYLIALGPAYGESLLVRVPPGEWLVVDALRNRAGGPAEVAPLKVLEARGAHSASVVITHPHDDHADGFATVVAEHDSGPVGCGPLFVSAPDEWAYSADAERVLRRGATEHSLAAIIDRWERDPESRWELIAGSHREVGEARLTVLYPTPEAQERWARRTSVDFNQLSSPLLLTWRQARVVLGADLPGQRWREVDDMALQGGGHDVLKVPHHGSKSAVPPELCRGARSRTWVVTPWRLGAFLPVFSADEGVERILRCVDAVHVTALPVAVARPPTWPIIRRRDIEATRRRSRFGELTLDYVEPTRHFRDSWVLVGLDEDGTVVELEHGPDAAVVVE